MNEGRAGAPGDAMPAPAAGSLAPRLEFWIAKGSTILVELAAFLRERTKAWLRPAQGDDSPPPAAAGYMGAWRTAASRNIAIVAVFSVAVNLLMLTLPIYLFQISDRVLTSRSADTLADAVDARPLLRGGPVPARHPAPPGAGPARHQAGRLSRGAGPGQHRQQRARGRGRQRPHAAQPAAGAQLHFQSDDAAADRRADRTDLFRRHLPHPPPSRLSSRSPAVSCWARLPS